MKNKTAGACHPLADDVEIFFVAVIRLLFESKQKCNLSAFAKCMHSIIVLQTNKTQTRQDTVGCFMDLS